MAATIGIRLLWFRSQMSAAESRVRPAGSAGSTAEMVVFSTSGLIWLNCKQDYVHKMRNKTRTYSGEVPAAQVGL